MKSRKISKLPVSFYRRDDVVTVSRELLGKVLCTNIGGELTRAIITETEAYAGTTDRASHAYDGRRTKRTEPMYANGGSAYVYLCYGIHHLFNVVTNREGIPHAVLLRAGKPAGGIERMRTRRAPNQSDRKLLAGPGSLAKALGITTALTGTSLQSGEVWIENHGIAVDDKAIASGPRVGVDYAGKDAKRPYRFIVEL